MSVDFRNTFVELAPPWLLGTTGKALLLTFGSMVNALYAQTRLGVKARFPTYAPDDQALQHIGNDRSIERGPAQSAANFRARLIKAVDSNTNRGGGRTLLDQLAAYFDGTGTPPIRLVSSAHFRPTSQWHEYNWTTGVTTKTVTAVNWDWDGDPGKWWRGWVIIDATTLGWVGWDVEPGGAIIGDGHTIGSTATVQDVQSIQRIVQRWKPANVHVKRIIVTRNASLFERTDASPPNPNGDYGDSANWNANAAYWLGGGENET